MGMTPVPRSPYLYALMEQGLVRHHSKGATFTSTDEGGEVIMVVDGYVKRYSIFNDGSTATQIMYGPQDVFPLTRVFDNLRQLSLHDGPQTFYYETLTDAHVLNTSLDELRQVTLNNPLVYRDLFTEAGHHLKWCVHTIENIGFKTTYQRVAHQILYFAREFGTSHGQSVVIDVPLTHQDISDMLGTTRATISLAITKLKKDGLLDEGRTLMVTDLVKLTEAVYA